jgi:hypothetical protein
MTPLEKTLELLNLHHKTFFEAKPFADETQHPNPSDTRGWSQILVSLLYQKKGLTRQKGADIEDGSDVKAASTWDAIDTPRFNGVIKAGTKSELSGNMASLDAMPKLFFVLWDNEPENNQERCRVWVVRPQRDEGTITSNNFQLHPPRKLNTNIFRNTCGNLNYPLLFGAEWVENQYVLTYFEESILENGVCSYAD